MENNTNKQFERVLAVCRELFSKKLYDYGASWRIMRPESLTDQIFIKAKRIRTLETGAENLVGEDINSEQWIDLLCVNDPDEKHFLILQNSIIVGYMKINGLIGKETAWLSMLIIAEKYKRQGIGAYAISFAEKFAKNSGFENLCIQTTSDNEPAKSLYRKCGYNGKLYTEKGRWYFTKRLY